MLEKIRTLIKQKAQGIVEYALLLAFVVGIAMMLNGANLDGAVKETFDKVAVALGMKRGYASALEKWGKIPRSELLSDETKDERIKADQEALANIGEFFLGMKKDDVKNLLLDDYCTSNKTLVHIGENDDETLGHAMQSDDPLSYVIDKGGGDVIKSDHATDVIHWMQHDYGNHDGTGYNTSLDHDSASRYFFSDYAAKNNFKPTGNDAYTGGNNGYIGNGVKLQLTYAKDSNNVERVTSAKVEIDSLSINNHKELSMKVSKDENGNVVRTPTYQ